jgi:hypothetical protein
VFAAALQFTIGTSSRNPVRGPLGLIVRSHLRTYLTDGQEKEVDDLVDTFHKSAKTSELFENSIRPARPGRNQ